MGVKEQRLGASDPLSEEGVQTDISQRTPGRLSAEEVLTASKQPIGLFYLAATEALTAFALYGTLGLLVLYLTGELLTADNAEGVVGFDWFAASLVSFFGPVSSLALASQIFGLFAGLICFTPLAGGLVADRFLSQRAAIIIGALLQVAGYSALAWKETFLLALLLLIIGSGLVTTNLKAQIGALYTAQDPRRSRGFGLSLIAVNIGAFAAPFICGTIGELHGWRLGFAAAAVGMASALLVYLIGFRHLPYQREQQGAAEQAAPHEVRSIYGILGVIGLNIFYFATYNQTFNIFAVWARDKVDRDFLGFEVPVTWLLSLDALFAVTATLGLMAHWKAQASKNSEPGDSIKLRCGFAFLACAFITLFSVSNLAQGGVPLLLTLPFFAFTAAASAFIFTSSLSLISRHAPERMKATMLGLYAVSAFAGNVMAGWVGGFYEVLGAADFWLLNGSIAATGLLLSMLLPVRHWLKADIS